MRLLKSNSLLSLVNSYMVDSPQPANISYMWNFGSLLATCLGIQIVTGIFLAMHYTPNVDLAFISVEHIMRDVNYGWLLRYLHANTASFFFIFVYMHIGRGLYYGSYKSPRVLPWSIGVIILVLMMAIAFLGYLSSPKWLDSTFFDINAPATLMASSPVAGPVISSPRLKAILVQHNLSPLAIWEDLHLPDVKGKVQKSLRFFSGVYCIINLVNGNMYVGSGILGNIGKRFHKHLYAGIGSSLVWAAVKKYGLCNFAFVLLDTVPSTNTTEDNSELLALEDKYILMLSPKYNIAPKAGNTFGLLHKEETKQHMRAIYSSELVQG